MGRSARQLMVLSTLAAFCGCQTPEAQNTKLSVLDAMRTDQGTAAFLGWCKKSAHEPELRSSIKLLLWQAGASYWLKDDCEGAAPKLTSLEELDLHKSFLVDVRPLAALPKLRKLNLSFNEINDLAPLASLPRLEYLDLQYNEVKDIAPLAGLPNLKVLYLWENPVQDLAILQAFPVLENRRKVMNRHWDWSITATELSASFIFTQIISSVIR